MTALVPPALRAHPRLTTAVAVIVVAGVASGSYVALHGDATAQAVTTTTTQAVSTGTLRQSVSATGTLAPAKDESLSFAVSGQVTRVAVKAGQRVSKGQVLATVDSAALRSAVAQARSSVASARAKVDDDQTSSASSTQLSADQAALKAARNQLASARSQLAGATLRSPITGAVAAVNLTVGQSVSGGSSSGGGAGTSTAGGSTGTTASSSAEVEVISTDAWIVNASVDASSVGTIKTGNQAQLTITGATDTVYGTVASIGLVSSSTSGTASYPVVIDVTGSPSGLHDGESVTATVIYQQLTGVLVIPQLALHRNSDGTTYVEKLVNGVATATTVTTGLTSGAEVQIKSGLASGDQIVVPQLQRTGGTGTTGSTGTTGGSRGGYVPGAGTGNFPAGGTGNFPGGGAVPAGGNGD
jgi:macrolide-specific efflux system membrane fusion protein